MQGAAPALVYRALPVKLDAMSGLLPLGHPSREDNDRDPTRPDRGTCQGANAFPACTGYFSFDGVHPTAAIQRAAFDDMERQFNLSGAVPEPASWALMIIGFGMIGGALRRRDKVATTIKFA